MLRFWRPYTEYSLHTSLTEAELTGKLTRECRRDDLADLFSRRAWKDCFSTGTRREVLLRRHCGDPFCLNPTVETRNALKGLIFISARNAPGGGCDLRIVIRPGRESLVFSGFWLAFLIFVSFSAVADGHRIFPFLSMLMLAGMWGILIFCRRKFVEDIPTIRTAFALLIDRLEREKAR